MCNNCIHKAVCSKFIATGGVSRCEQFREERKGQWLSAYEYALKLGIADKEKLEEAKKDKWWKFCNDCEQPAKGRHNYCPNCGADMRGCLQEIATAAKQPRNDTEGCGADMRGKEDEKSE